jgi:hypothetical protein
MILAQFLFQHQVAQRLYAMGWRRKDLPAKKMFNDLCGALRASGYGTEKAADLWNKCLQYDREAIEQLKRDSGLYGILHLRIPMSQANPSSKRQPVSARVLPNRESLNIILSPQDTSEKHEDSIRVMARGIHSTKTPRKQAGRLGGVARSIIEKTGNGTRRRRSAEDAAELKREIRAARRKNMPVKEIAANLGITPAYVYQLQR